MTMPRERYNALLKTQDFLVDLMDATKTPDISNEIRAQAARCLKHYPMQYHLDIIAEETEVLEN